MEVPKKSKAEYFFINMLYKGLPSSYSHLEASHQNSVGGKSGSCCVLFSASSKNKRERKEEMMKAAQFSSVPEHILFINAVVILMMAQLIKVFSFKR